MKLNKNILAGLISAALLSACNSGAGTGASTTGDSSVVKAAQAKSSVNAAKNPNASTPLVGEYYSYTQHVFVYNDQNYAVTIKSAGSDNVSGFSNVYMPPYTSAIIQYEGGTQFFEEDSFVKGFDVTDGVNRLENFEIGHAHGMNQNDSYLYTQPDGQSPYQFGRLYSMAHLMAGFNEDSIIDSGMDNMTTVVVLSDDDTFKRITRDYLDELHNATTGDPIALGNEAINKWGSNSHDGYVIAWYLKTIMQDVPGKINNDIKETQKINQIVSFITSAIDAFCAGIDSLNEGLPEAAQNEARGQWAAYGIGSLIGLLLNAPSGKIDFTAPGSYQTYCKNTQIDTRTYQMTSECQDTSGNNHVSSLNYASCFGSDNTGAVENHNGNLECSSVFGHPAFSTTNLSGHAGGPTFLSCHNTLNITGPYADQVIVSDNPANDGVSFSCTNSSNCTVEIGSGKGNSNVIFTDKAGRTTQVGFYCG